MPCESPTVLTKIQPALALLGIGWYFALSIVVGVVGGLLVDGWLGSKPLFTMIGLFAGLIVAFWGGYRILMRVVSQRNQKQGSG
ncbi:MAG: AtpZ/AtpI family protein [Vicinamibacterales bacterium]